MNLRTILFGTRTCLQMSMIQMLRMWMLPLVVGGFTSQADAQTTCTRMSPAAVANFVRYCSEISAICSDQSSAGPTFVALRGQKAETNIYCYERLCHNGEPSEQAVAQFSQCSLMTAGTAAGAGNGSSGSGAGGDGGSQCSGSVISPEDGSLGEQIDLIGTNYRLVYLSSRTPAFKAAFVIEVRLTTSSVPAGTQSYRVEIFNEAGTRIQNKLYSTPTANLIHRYTWNGNNAQGLPAGRPLRFTVKVTETNSSYTLALDPQVVIVGNYQPHTLGLGHWSIDKVHFYDPISQTLYRGDSSQLPVKAKTISGGYQIAEPDESLVHEFNTNGRHLRTRLGLTGSVVLTVTYDTAGRISRLTEAFNRRTTFERDASGRLTGILSPFNRRTIVSLDANGNMASLTSPTNQIHSMTMTAAGLLSDMTFPSGRKSTFTYGSTGLLTRDEDSGGFLAALTRTKNIDGSVSSQLQSRLGRVDKFKTSYHGDSFEREHTAPNGVKSTWSKTLSPSGSINRSSVVAGVSSSESGIDSRRFPGMAQYVTNISGTPSGASRATSITHSVSLNTATDPFSIKTWTRRFTTGNMSTTVAYTGANQTFVTTSKLLRTTRTQIDAYERPVSIQLGNQTPSVFAYTNDRLMSVTQGTRVTSYTYNSAGLVNKVTDPLLQATTYAYDASDRLTAQTLPGARIIRFAYDAGGRLRSITPPGRTAHVFEYNSKDLSSLYRPPAVSGVTPRETLYDYNDDKQLVKTTRADGQAIEFVYHATRGTLSSFRTAEGNYPITYNASNGQPSDIRTPKSFRNVLSYQGTELRSDQIMAGSTVVGTVSRNFDATYGRVSQEIVSVGSSTSTINRTYDADEYLTKIGDLSMVYNVPNGQLTGTTFGIITDLYSYNAFGEITGYTAKVSGVDVYKYTLTRDATGRVTRKVETQVPGAVTWNYTYDTSTRLASVKRGSSIVGEYAYDLNGNRNGGKIRNVATTATYDAQDRLRTYNALTFTYSNAGDLLSKRNTTTNQTTSYEYDVFGNLRKVTLPNATVIEYEVDALNRRIGKKVAGALQVRYLYQDQLRIAAELNANGTLKRRYVYGTKSNIPDYFIEGSQKYRIISDHLGSPRQVIRLSDGLIVHEMDHDEFGRVVKNAPAGYLPFGYAGGLYDAQTGLVRFGARDYDPEIGRWTSKDPIRFAGGDTNLYGYVANDPVNWIDPLGLYQVCTRPVNGLPMFDHSYIKFPEGDTISWGPSGNPLGSPGRNNTNDSGGTCGPNQDSTPEQDQRMRDWARQNERNRYWPIGNNCHNFVRDAINAGR